MKPDDIERLAKQIRVKASATTRDRILADAQAALAKSTTPGTKAPKPGLSIWRIIMKSRITKLAAAALIIIVGLISLSRFGGSIDGTSIALAQMSEKMKQMPWMHCVSNMKRPGEENAEYWFSFDMEIEAQKYENGKLIFYDYKTLLGYFYTPDTNEVTISRIPENRLFAAGAFSPWEFLETTVELLAKNEGATITHETDESDNVEIFKVRVPRGTPEGSLGIEEWIFTADSLSHLVVSLKCQGYDPNGTFMEVAEMSFNYPDNGPIDIYEIGAPQAATVIDNRPDSEVEEIISNYRAARKKVIPRYMALIAKSYFDKHIDSEVIFGVDIIYTDGQLQRFERYLIINMQEYFNGWSKYSAEMGDDLESLLKWWTQADLSQCTRIDLYDGQYFYKGYHDGEYWLSNNRRHFPKGYPWIHQLPDLMQTERRFFAQDPDFPPITIVENSYAKENNLICLQVLREGEIHDTSITWPSRKLFYLNPQKDYLIERFEEQYTRNASWQKDESWLNNVDEEIIEKSAESTVIREVIDFGQTETGHWYPSVLETRITPVLTDGTVDTRDKKYSGKLNRITVYLDTESVFPDGIFDPENMPDANE